jgi:hypothetical protein
MSGAAGSSQWMYATGFDIDQSLRFDDGRTTYLARTPLSAGNRKTFTFSAWVKRSTITVQQTLMSVNSANNNSGILHIYLASDDKITISFQAFTLTTTPVLRDISAWYHIMFVADTTQAAEGNRFKIYLNGTALTLGSSGTFIAQNTDLAFCQATEHNIGRRDGDADRYFDGYLAEVNFIDGAALTPASFGETDNVYGHWKPTKYSGTFGTTGFYLPFKQDYTVEGFSTVTYRGNNIDDRYIGGVGFKPDFVWNATRSASQNRFMFDAVRGAEKDLRTNQAVVEGTSDALTSFQNDGFTVGTGNDGNESGETYVSWCWDMGGSNANNTTGDIDSVVRASQTYGQSIVTYTGTGTAGTIGHGLATAPDMIILKRRNGDGGDTWPIFHSSINAGWKIEFNTAAEADDLSNQTFGNLPNSVTSSTFAVGDHARANADGGTYVAYLFHAVTGYSAFGKYASNNNTTGPAIDTGFKPAFVMIKAHEGASGNWMIFDNTRSPNNEAIHSLKANDNSVELADGSNNIDFDSDGFQIKSNTNDINGNGRSYIYMAFADNREYAYYLDQSGNNNDWTSNSLTESDISVDSPTNNFATLNPLQRFVTNKPEVQEGNLKTICGSVNTGSKHCIAATMAMTSGKWYFEVMIGTTTNSHFSHLGVANSDVKEFTELMNTTANSGNVPWDSDYGWGYDAYNGKKEHDNTQTSYGSQASLGDIIGVAVDMDNGKIWFADNNTYIASGDPAAGSNAAYTNLAGTIVPVVSTQDGSTAFVTMNFGQDSSFAGGKTAQGNSDGGGIGDFFYAPPSGFLALCTDNLPNQDTVPSDYFNTVLYTGNGNDNRAVTGVGFQPDWVWIKGRTQGESTAHDSLRGPANGLFFESETAEDTGGNLVSFDSDGFTTADSNRANRNSQAIVAWCWKAGGGAASVGSNTDGSINTTDTSVNTDAGFSISTFIGNATSGATVGHGLGVVPEWYFVICRSTAGNRLVYHASNTAAPETDVLAIETTGATADQENIWNDTAPTSAVISLGNNASVNGNNETFVAYFFHSVEGYSKFGSYTATGNADGPFIYLGFQPAFLLTKRTDSGDNWRLTDNAREPSNDGAFVALKANATDSEGDTGNRNFDYLSNGFKVRETDADMGADGGTYIYMAFAEIPFKYSNAR